jgi:hypothetical protein
VKVDVETNEAGLLVVVEDLAMNVAGSRLQADGAVLRENW